MSKSLALATNWAYHQLPDALSLLTITWRIWRLKAYSWVLGTNKRKHYANGQPLPSGESGAGIRPVLMEVSYLCFKDVTLKIKHGLSMCSFISLFQT
jgi:hypothetical protein